MNKSTLIALLLILAVILLGGWKQVRGSFAREEVMRGVFKAHR